jgi:hypothetical protein
MAVIATCRLHAQGWESVVPGSRVSIRVTDSIHAGGLRRNAVVGTVLDRDSSFVYLRVTAADTLRVPRSSITALAVSKGRSRTRSAIKYALLEGALFGAFLPCSRETPRKVYLTVGAGTVVGAVIGALVPDERWRRVKR